MPYLPVPGNATGADHFYQAERLLAIAAEIETNGDEPPHGEQMAYIERLTARAQAHATLALAAATARPQTGPSSILGYGWYNVAGKPLTPFNLRP